MTVFAEVRDALTAAADAIDHTRKIVHAINEGKEYLKARHPDAQDDLRKLVEEMEKTLRGLADVSSVVTHFQFTVAGSGRDLEPARFNNYVIANKRKIQTLASKVNDLRGSSGKIGMHWNALNERTGESWFGWPRLFGVREEPRRREITGLLEEVYLSDLDIIVRVERMVQAVEMTLRQVTEALGSAAAADPRNVPAAAQVLGEYAAEFAKVERECVDVVGGLYGLIDHLRR